MFDLDPDFFLNHCKLVSLVVSIPRIEQALLAQTSGSNKRFASTSKITARPHEWPLRPTALDTNCTIAYCTGHVALPVLLAYCPCLFYWPIALGTKNFLLQEMAKLWHQPIINILWYNGLMWYIN